MARGDQGRHVAMPCHHVIICYLIAVPVLTQSWLLRDVVQVRKQGCQSGQSEARAVAGQRAVDSQGLGLPVPPSTQTKVRDARPVTLHWRVGLFALKTSGAMPNANMSLSHVSVTEVK